MCDFMQEHAIHIDFAAGAGACPCIPGPAEIHRHNQIRIARAGIDAGVDVGEREWRGVRALHEKHGSSRGQRASAICLGCCEFYLACACFAEYGVEVCQHASDNLPACRPGSGVIETYSESIGLIVIANAEGDSRSIDFAFRVDF